MANNSDISKSKNNCCVPQCSATYKDKISLHKFPSKNKILFKKWSVALKMGKQVSPYMKVCSRHFQDDDFFYKAHVNQLARLKKTAVPSVNLPVRDHDRILNSTIIEQRTRRKEQRTRKREQPAIEVEEVETEVEEVEPAVEPIVKVVSDNHGEEIISNLLFFKENPTTFTKIYDNQAVQVNTYEEFASYNLDTLVDTDYKCKTLTGIADLTQLNILANAISKVSAVNTNLSAKNKVLLTLMKIKLDLTFSSLAVMFSVSEKAARAYFHSTIKQLSIILKPIIRFPPKEEILCNMPRCFTKYKSTRIVLDCTEIGIEKSKCLKCRIKSYSFYKKRNTIKYLIGVAPSGLITFLSKGYGGRASDKAIFNAENLIEKLSPGDAIMVDKGILIEDECNENFIKLIRPPFLRKSTQFSKMDAESTAAIARARVHVERAIQRIKIFKICKGTIFWSMLPYMDDIMTVIVALSNLGSPILANNKF